MGNCNDGACVIDKTKQEMDTSQKRGYIRAAISFVMLIAGIIFSAVGLSFFADKWVHLRKSNTEPIIRVYSEASTAEAAEEIGQKIMKVIEDLAK